MIERVRQRATALYQRGTLWLLLGVLLAPFFAAGCLVGVVARGTAWLVVLIIAATVEGFYTGKGTKKAGG